MTELQAILKLMERVEELEQEVKQKQSLVNTWYARAMELEGKDLQGKPISKPLNLEETGEF